ncbi:MAG: EamA family transporter [Chloroflexi bacterium]|nr:EamA family transporter [Chloroflexota bacterium]
MIISPTASPGAPDPKPTEGALARAVSAVPPPGLVLFSIVSIQLGAAVAVNLFPVLGPVGTAFLRVAFSAVLLIAAARHTIAWSARSHAGSLLLYGAILGVMNLSFYGAISRIPLGIAVAIEFVGPLGLAVATSRRGRDFAWIALAAVGIVLLTPEIGGSLDPLGVALAGAAGLCWAGFIVMSRRIGRALPGSSGLAIGMAVAALVVLPVEVVVGGLGSLDPGLLVAALAVAILSTALPLSLEFEALKRLTARTYAILVTLEPAVAAMVGAILLGQAMGPQGLLAVACVTAAALGVTLSDRRASGDPPPLT